MGYPGGRKQRAGRGRGAAAHRSPLRPSVALRRQVRVLYAIRAKLYFSPILYFILQVHCTPVCFTHIIIPRAPVCFTHMMQFAPRQHHQPVRVLRRGPTEQRRRPSVWLPSRRGGARRGARRRARRRPPAGDVLGVDRGRALRPAGRPDGPPDPLLLAPGAVHAVHALVLILRLPLLRRERPCPRRWGRRRGG